MISHGTNTVTLMTNSVGDRAGNEPSYSGSTQARLKKSSARAQLVS